MANLPWIQTGADWVHLYHRDARTHAYCELLESGKVLFSRDLPFRWFCKALPKFFLVAANRVARLSSAEVRTRRDFERSRKTLARD